MISDSQQPDDARDAMLIVALASGRTQKDAAAEAGCSAKTVQRRLQDPTFSRQVREARGPMFAESLGQLAAAQSEAVTTLKWLLCSADQRIRLMAATKIVELGSKLRDQIEIDARLSDLEQAAEAR